MSPHISVVTGSNKGIGFSCVRQLAEINENGVVYLTARDEKKGEIAVEKLKQAGLENVSFHQLDICDPASCEAFVDHIKNAHGKLDVLVNNAGIAFRRDATEPFGVQAKVTMATNYWATQQFSVKAFPLLASNARVVNVSSLLGHLSCLNGGKEPEASALRTKLADPNISIETLNDLANDFVQRAQRNQHLEAGWINSAYSVSKIFVSVLTRVQQREVDKKRLNENILVNAVHPGYVDTDMTNHRGVFTPDRGAQPLVWCATIPEGKEKPRGGYIWHDNSIVDFTASSYPSS